MTELKLSHDEIASAADAGNLFLCYQPKLDLRSGAISGVEALARWQHPRQGAIPPVEFIPAVERSGLIDWFSTWALSTAIAQWKRWDAAGVQLDLAVNISALNLERVCFPDRVAAICVAHEMPTSRLIVELTESATQHATRLMDTISRFRLKGIGVSLDDFGTGYGSLVQLRSLPFTELKIDRSFVMDLLVSKDSRAITLGLIRIAHDLGLCVTAEGVEDQETLTTLTSFGCDKAQGYHIARPMAGERLELWVQNWGRMVTQSGQSPPVRDVISARAQ